MQTLLPTCKSLSLLNASPPLSSIATTNCCRTQSNFPKSPCFHSFPTFGSPKTSSLLKIFIARGNTCVSIFSQNGDFSNTQFPENVEDERIQEVEDLELLNKPSPVVVDNVLVVEVDKEPEKPDKDEALAPFLKFFKPRDSLEDVEEEKSDLDVREERRDGENEEKEDKKVSVEYYEPKPGDCVVGVVISGNENKLDVSVGADLLGTMLTKEVLPLYEGELEYLLCDLKRDAEEFLVKGKMGIVKDEAAVSGGLGPGKPVMETGTVLFAEVLGRTLSGRPLLSTRRQFRRMAWHRVRQIKELNEPIEVKITEWNTGGLLTRIEGLRAFLPRAELMNKVNNFKELKENVGRCKNVLITRINEANNDLILSEREAWEMLHLREGTLLEGTVKKILPYGAQVQIGETNRSGLLHISNISKSRINAVSDLLQVGEKVKVLVVKSMLAYKISLSIADLESEPGLFTTNKEKVFAEAEDMAKKYRQKLPAAQTTQKLENQPSNYQHFNNEETLYVNWKWFKFERE